MVFQFAVAGGCRDSVVTWGWSVASNHRKSSTLTRAATGLPATQYQHVLVAIGYTANELGELCFHLAGVNG